MLPSSSCLLGHVSSLQCGSSPIIDIPLDHMSQMRVCTNQTETNCTLIGGGVPSTDVIVYVTAINHRGEEAGMTYCHYMAVSVTYSMWQVHISIFQSLCPG